MGGSSKIFFSRTNKPTKHNFLKPLRHPVSGRKNSASSARENTRLKGDAPLKTIGTEKTWQRKSFKNRMFADHRIRDVDYFQERQLKKFENQRRELKATEAIIKIITGYSIPFAQKPPAIPFSKPILRKFETKPSPGMPGEIAHFSALES